MTNSEVVKKFVDRINAHDAEGLTALMSPDHVFIDSLGNKFGRPEIETGWRRYFAAVPDYWIRIERVVTDGPDLILFGTAGGTYVPNGDAMKSENVWETPAVWRAVIQNGVVSEWRIYADNEPIRAKMRAVSHEPDSAQSETRDDRLSILEAKLATGEITAEEYVRLSKTVGKGEGPPSEATRELVDWRKLEEEVKKGLQNLTRQEAEERYSFLSGKPISDLTDAEYEERLALAEKLSEKPNTKRNQSRR